MLYLQRLIFGLRRLFLQPALSVPIILSLGLTLAAVLTVLSIYYALMVRPLPQIKAPEQLSIHSAQVKLGSTDLSVMNKALFMHFKQHMQSYGEWAYVISQTEKTAHIEQQEHQLTLLEASAGAPELLGIQLLLGESSATADEQSGVWISESVWQQLYKADTAVIGKTLSYEDHIYKIAGVYKDTIAIPTPQRPTALQFWQFFDKKIQQSAETNSFGMPGIAILRGQQQPDEAAMLQWVELAKQDYIYLSRLVTAGVFGSTHEGYHAKILGDSAKLVWLLLAVTFTILVIAALNLTNLLLAHYQSRRQEFAVQMLTGCSALKLKLLVAIENLALVVPAVILGVLASLWLIKSLPLIVGYSLPLLNSIHLDNTVLGILSVIGAVLLLLFSWPVQIPAQLAESLSGSGKGQQKQQNATLVNCLFVGQLVLSTIIVCGSALLAYQGYREVYTDYGFERVNSYLIDTNPTNSTPYGPEQRQEKSSRQQYQQQNELLQKKLRQHWPDAIVMNSRQQPISSSMHISQLSDKQSNIVVNTNFALVDGQYFAAYSIPLLYGRSFTAEDSELQVIIDLTTAKAFSADDPSQMIGRRLGEKQVIGIVASTKNINKMPTSYYLSMPLSAESQQLVVVLPDGEYLTALEVKKALGELAAEYPELRIESMRQNWLDNTRQERLNFYLISAIAATSLVLALLGIAGISQQQSRQKRYEIAVRMATGASRRQLLWFATRRSGLLLLLGLLAGSGLTLLIFNYLSGYFSLLSAMNWQALLVLELLLMWVALSAMLWPCWQVIRKDPIQTLRNQ
ncbi:FtsX-like permease family protein [Rheinheimera soli]|uniref:FtsX-like permease family protein n=1 Tax=Rheinheimera soli TaxID=443616 RepID=UPI001E644089|nr:FtsX-like permease family protein [Rheinheimera soli]